MTTFDIDREIQHTLEQKWGTKDLSADEKIAKITEYFLSLPIEERQKIYNYMKREIKKIGFDEEKYNQLPH
jgi:hypothetical protein